MEYQEITQIWNSADRKIEDMVQINRTLLKEVSIRKIKSQLSEIKWTSILEISINSFFMVFLMKFIVTHIFTFEYSISAGILMLITTFSLVFSSYKLSLFRKIDSRHSVLETQKAIERMKYLERIEKNLLLVIIPLFSPAFLIIMVSGIFDYNLVYIENWFIEYTQMTIGTWLILYTLGSVLIAMIVVFILKKFPNKNLQKSISFLKEIDDIEKQS